MTHIPVVSVGLPVHNGERYLAAALDSILAQTLTNFELIISDNASTDATEAISCACAARDRRVRYVRAARNLGAAANYNRVFRLARAPYFKWAAHDDLLDPRFLELCVHALETSPEAVVCCPAIRIIDADGRILGIHRSRLRHGLADRLSDRFAAMILEWHPCLEVFGVIRRSALERTALHRGYPNGDRALLAELTLLGPFLALSEPLLLNRDHPDRFTRIRSLRERILWHDTDLAGCRLVPLWHLYRDYVRTVRAHVHQPERVRCYRHLARWWIANANWARVVAELLDDDEPRVWEAMRRFKRAIFGEAPSPIEVDDRPPRL